MMKKEEEVDDDDEGGRGRNIGLKLRPDIYSIVLLFHCT